MKEMIRKILDAIPENEIRNYLEEKGVIINNPSSKKLTIDKLRIKEERVKYYMKYLDKK